MILLEPLPKSHACPYDGRNYDMKSRGKGYTPVECGVEGYLCQRCRQDRADRRVDAILRTAWDIFERTR